MSPIASFFAGVGVTLALQVIGVVGCARCWPKRNKNVMDLPTSWEPKPETIVRCVN